MSRGGRTLCVGAPGRAARTPPAAPEEHRLAEQPADERPEAVPGDADPGAAAAGPPRKRRTVLLVGLAAFVLVADLVSKLVVVARCTPGRTSGVLGGLST